MARAGGHRVLESNALLSLGAIAHELAEFDVADQLFKESLALNVELGNKGGMAKCWNNLGSNALATGDLQKAKQYLELGKECYLESGGQRVIALIAFNLGVLATMQGDQDLAFSHFNESLTSARERGNLRLVAVNLSEFVGLACKAGDYARAAKVSGAFDAIEGRIGASVLGRERETYDPCVQEAREALGEERFAEMWAAGHVMTLDQAIAFVLGPRDAPDARRE
jgi:tetratricopeptide (TPR) repeat protein